MSEQKRNVKIWTAVSNSKSGMMVTENSAYVVSDHNNYLGATPNGIILSGDGVTLNTSSENIRGGGTFVKMNDLVQMIPQTLVTPMSNQIPFPPLAFASNIIKELPNFMAMAGG